jgi:hypothetical protein
MIAANRELGDAGDDRHQDDGEEGADVEDLEFFAELPGEAEEEKDADGEQDVAACGYARLFCALCVGGWVGLGKACGRQCALLMVTGDSNKESL